MADFSLNSNIKKNLIQTQVSTQQNKAETKSASTAQTSAVNKSTTKLSSIQIQDSIANGSMSTAKAVSTLKSDLSANVKTTKTANNKTTVQTSVSGKSITINTNAKDVPITTSSTTIPTASTVTVSDETSLDKPKAPAKAPSSNGGDNGDNNDNGDNGDNGGNTSGTNGRKSWGEHLNDGIKYFKDVYDTDNLLGQSYFKDDNFLGYKAGDPMPVTTSGQFAGNPYGLAITAAGASATYATGQKLKDLIIDGATAIKDGINQLGNNIADKFVIPSSGKTGNSNWGNYGNNGTGNTLIGGAATVGHPYTGGGSTLGNSFGQYGRITVDTGKGTSVTVEGLTPTSLVNDDGSESYLFRNGNGDLGTLSGESHNPNTNGTNNHKSGDDWTDGFGTHHHVNEDGSETCTYKNGTTIIYYPDGTEVVVPAKNTDSSDEWIPEILDLYNSALSSGNADYANYLSDFNNYCNNLINNNSNISLSDILLHMSTYQWQYDNTVGFALGYTNHGVESIYGGGYSEEQLMDLVMYGNAEQSVWAMNMLSQMHSSNSGGSRAGTQMVNIGKNITFITTEESLENKSKQALNRYLAALGQNIDAMLAQNESGTNSSSESRAPKRSAASSSGASTSTQMSGNITPVQTTDDGMEVAINDNDWRSSCSERAEEYIDAHMNTFKLIVDISVGYDLSDVSELFDAAFEEFFVSVQDLTSMQYGEDGLNALNANKDALKNMYLETFDTDALRAEYEKLPADLINEGTDDYLSFNSYVADRLSQFLLNPQPLNFT